jgi:thiamine monophosphate kinase
VLRFTAAQHRQGRIEERSERVKERLLSTTYREAWQVWLQSGEDFVLLADVSDEQGAQAIVRRLQAEDERIARFGNRDNDQGSYGPRQSPG